uniref:Uncharacterized protein n=1 Tax=Triticum urartu TaxID=4572 RepID=A0A8R7Q1S4_TRIUA
PPPPPTPLLAATHLRHTSPSHLRSSPHSQIQLATVERGDRGQDLRDALIVVANRSSADPRKFPGAKVPRGVRAAVRPPRVGPVRDGGGERPPQQGRRRGLEGEARLRWQRAGGGGLTLWSSAVGTSQSRVWPPSQVSEQHQEEELKQATTMHHRSSRWVASGTCNGFAANIISEFPVAVTTAATAYLPLMGVIFC